MSNSTPCACGEVVYNHPQAGICEGVLIGAATDLVNLLTEIAMTTTPDHRASLAYNAFAYLAGEENSK